MACCWHSSPWDVSYVFLTEVCAQMYSNRHQGDVNLWLWMLGLRAWAKLMETAYCYMGSSTCMQGFGMRMDLVV